MVEGYSFFYSVIAPIVALASSIFSLVATIGSAIDLGRSPWEHTIPKGWVYSAFILTGFGVISQITGWVSGYLPLERTFLSLHPFFSEGFLGFSLFFLVVTIINQKKRDSY